MGRCRLFICTACLVFISLNANSKDTILGNTDYLYPAAINTFEIEGGIANKDKLSSKNSAYYKISYRGSLLASQGTPFQYASSQSLVSPKPDTAAGDVHDITFTYEDGGILDGALFSATKTAPIKLRGLGDSLRGTGFIGGNIKNKTYQIAIGLETKPLHLNSASNAGFSNWLVFGAAGQHQEATDNASRDNSMFIMTYRAFLGKAFGWNKCTDVISLSNKVAAFILNEAPTFNEALVIREKINSIPAAKRTRLQEVFSDAVSETERLVRTENFDNKGSTKESQDPNTKWRQSVENIALGDTDAMSDCPTVATYAELSGWYTVSGESYGDNNKSLFTVTTDYWPLTTKDNVFLRVRYEYGYERSAPMIKRDQLMLSLVLRF